MLMRGLLMVPAALVVLSTALIPAEQAQTKTGRVAKVSVETRTVLVDTVAFTVDDNTKIVQGDQAKTLADVKGGILVRVDYRLEARTQVAVKITLLPQPASLQQATGNPAFSYAAFAVLAGIAVLLIYRGIRAR